MVPWMRMNAAETNEAGSVDIRVVARIHVFEHSRIQVPPAYHVSTRSDGG
jgi:hypothetical protein